MSERCLNVALSFPLSPISHHLRWTAAVLTVSQWNSQRMVRAMVRQPLQVPAESAASPNLETRSSDGCEDCRTEEVG